MQCASELCSGHELRGLNWKTLLAFLDDVLIMGKSFDDHLENLDAALKRFRKFGLKLKPKNAFSSKKKSNS